jgi:hypothetical protein
MSQNESVSPSHSLIARKTRISLLSQIRLKCLSNVELTRLLSPSDQIFSLDSTTTDSFVYPHLFVYSNSAILVMSLVTYLLRILRIKPTNAAVVIEFKEWSNKVTSGNFMLHILDISTELMISSRHPRSLSGYS